VIEEKSVAGIDLTAVEGKSIVEYLHRVPALQLHWLKPCLALLHNYQSSYESQQNLLLQSRSGFLYSDNRTKCQADRARTEGMGATKISKLKLKRKETR
jgi:hypothetical protein